MNPIVTVTQKTKHVVYQLTKQDLSRVREVKLVRGKGYPDFIDGICHEVCIMQAVAMVTTQADRVFNPVPPGTLVARDTYTDTPICVSATIIDYLIGVNDFAGHSDRQRASLKKVIPEIINTAPVKRIESADRGSWYEIRDESDPTYQAAEDQRQEILEEIGSQDDVPVSRKLALVRKAADLYRTGPGLVQG